MHVNIAKTKILIFEKKNFQFTYNDIKFEKGDHFVYLGLDCAKLDDGTVLKNKYRHKAKQLY